jgi:hypothetical protein
VSLLMEAEFSGMVAAAIGGVLFLVWALAVHFMLRATRATRAYSDDEATIGADDSPGTISGWAEVAGSPEALATKLTERLAHDGLGFLGPVKITGADRRAVSFEAISGTSGTIASTPGGLRRGVVRFAGAGKKTRIEYRIEARSGRLLLALGWLFVALGFASIVVGLVLVFTLVVSSPRAEIRSQAVQMIQAVHMIWPPFLFAALSRQPVKLIRTHFEALINNLPYA